MKMIFVQTILLNQLNDTFTLVLIAYVIDREHCACVLF